MTGPGIFGRPIVLDCEGLSRAVARDTYLVGVIKAARDSRCPVVVSAITLVEAVHAKSNQAALQWTLSRLTVEPVSEQIAADAAALLSRAGLHGHQHAIDAVVCATAMSLPGRPLLYTSDPDLDLLLDGQATVVALR
ncbi:MAG: hypothetical protein FWF02_07740 [Micrococcales bacterium]|nr:hypothetical protein [Micrococcales bacterium]MCL2667582.1 hypothetical protein [Micrococcales bacterium]